MPLDSLAPGPTYQQLAADPFVSAFVTANAGSGKTSTLVQRVARLLLHGARPDAVLCVTYTKAAAAEMQRRLFETLGDWAVASDEVLIEELAKLGEAGTVQPRRARKLFAEALETPGGLKIQTIHAFCETLLRRFPLEAEVSPGFRVAEGAEAEALSAEARVSLAHLVLAEPGGLVAGAYEHFAVELAHMHFEELLKALEGKREQVAGLLARDGYATTVWRRCGFADGRTHDPASLRAAAVSPPALDVALWGRMADVFAGGGKSDQSAAATMRSVVEHASGARGSFEDAWGVLFTDKNEPRWAEKPPAVLKREPGLYAALGAEQRRLNAARRVACAAAVARDTVHALILGAGYRGVYEQVKRRRGLLDFADLVHRASELLVKRADAAWVLYKLDGGIDHVLVDEAQDTAPEQWDILRALTGEFFSGAGALPPRDPDRTVFAVGDEKQSIYSFQGLQNVHRISPRRRA